MFDKSPIFNRITPLIRGLYQWHSIIPLNGLFPDLGNRKDPERIFMICV